MTSKRNVYREAAVFEAVQRQAAHQAIFIQVHSAVMFISVPGRQGYHGCVPKLTVDTSPGILQPSEKCPPFQQTATAVGFSLFAPTNCSTLLDNCK